MTLRILTLDRKKAQQTRQPPKPSRAEQIYARNLSRLAEHVGRIIVDVNPADDPEKVTGLVEMMRRYSEALGPWAESAAASMVSEVNERSLAVWKASGMQISESLRAEILRAPTGEEMRRLMASQVHLIKSIPTEAAKRVHELTIRGLEDSSRAKEIAAEIMRSGEVAKSRAMLIARTEVARASATLTQARAEYVGSEGYVWRTSKDGDVRPSHKKMNGSLIKWNSPPTLDGMTGHAGCLPNCRCWADVQLPE